MLIMRSLYSKTRPTKNVFFALGLSLFVMIVVVTIGVVCTAISKIIVNAFDMFPYHTIGAAVIFWLWFSYVMLPEDDDF